MQKQDDQCAIKSPVRDPDRNALHPCQQEDGMMKTQIHNSICTIRMRNKGPCVRLRPQRLIFMPTRWYDEDPDPQVCRISTCNEEIMSLPPYVRPRPLRLAPMRKRQCDEGRIHRSICKIKMYNEEKPSMRSRAQCFRSTGGNAMQRNAINKVDQIQ